MKKRLSLALALLLAQLNALAQSPTQKPPQPPAQSQTEAQQQSRPQASPSPQSDADEGDVVRITTNLVQFDAVVTDKKGRQVTDLRPEEFEVTVGGRRQTVTNVSYVVAQPDAGAATTTAARANDKSAPYVPPARVSPGDVRRTIALVVDDLGASFESTAAIRQGLKKFVEEQMQPGDLVAVMRTSAGMGALQQFTSDKNMLRRAIERVRWYPMGRSGVGSFAPIEAVIPSASDTARGEVKGRNGEGDDAGGRDPAEEFDEFRGETFSVGTLGALSFIVRGMEQLPGRKSVVMFSDGFEILDRKDSDDTTRVLASLRRLVDQANRASVVIYTVDARGLPVLGLTAEDSTGGRSPQEVLDEVNKRGANYFDTQDGLNYLAAETGGLFLHNNNDLGGLVRRALDDQKGYYLIGFRPDESVFETAGGHARFNDLGVKVKRPGLRARHRSGFIGVPDSEAKPARATRLQQLVGALSSPFSSGDVPLRLTSLFGGSREGGAVVSSIMHIDMGGFKFTDEPDGWRKAVLDVVALTFGEQGNVVDEINRTETVRVRAEAYDIVRRNGLVYQMQVPVKKPGAYQLRVAVRDAANERLGSASQFIEVPDLKKDRLALSGIVLQSSEMTAAQSAQAGADGPRKEPDPQGTSAVRRFRAGERVDYFFNIYNAQTEKATGRPRVQTQTRLFRDQEQIYAGPLTEFDLSNQTDMKMLHAATRIRLDALEAGEYVLQVVVTDALAPAKRRTASQWMDFEVVK
jgi:VWFA-related protein